MESRRNLLILGGGCGLLLLAGVAFVVIALIGVAPLSFFGSRVEGPIPAQVETISPSSQATQLAAPTLPASEAGAVASGQLQNANLTELYSRLNPGVVSIQVLINQNGQSQQAGGSGFILDEQGHIVTNNHVVDQADRVFIVFYDGFEERAEIVGTDPDSDLAVLKVDELPQGVHPLPLGDSDDVVEGQWTVAIGNPFGLDGSMSVGIVSAVGRSIPSGATPFEIPQAIQTDAAINPGNSGGPLLNLQGEIIGVNAQIASGGTRANSGVGFAIPSNVVRQVVPVLIEKGEYQWPWLGIRGGPVSLLYQQANDLESQDGAFITSVVEGGPAEDAGLQGASGSATIDGIEIPTGGDVIIGFDDEPVDTFADLLYFVSSQSPGDTVTLTILRQAEQQQVEVTLQARPE